jgi:hypothetical protein
VKVLVPYFIGPDQLVSSTVAEADQPEWVAGQSYVAGAMVQRTSVHRVYSRIATGGGTTPPEADPSSWQDRGATIRWAMWDGSIGTHTTASGSLSTTVAISGAADTVALLDVTGSSVSVSGAGGSGSAGVPSHGTVLLSGLGMGSGNVTVSVSGGGTVQVGACMIGTFTDLGTTLAGPKLGMTDKSKRSFDAFGRPTLVKRAFQRADEYQIAFPTSNLDLVAGALTAVRSQAALWVGIDWLGTSALYGLCTDWSLTRKAGEMSTGAIKISSLAMGVQL